MTDLKSLLDDVERALKPFAEKADLHGQAPDDLGFAYRLRIGHLRVARSTLSRLAAARAEMKGGKDRQVAVGDIVLRFIRHGVVERNCLRIASRDPDASGPRIQLWLQNLLPDTWRVNFEIERPSRFSPSSRWKRRTEG